MTERPQLRPYLQRVQDPRDPVHVYLVDRLGMSNPLRLTWMEFTWIGLFDGSRSLGDIQVDAMRQAGGHLLPLEIFQTLVRKLDDGLFLEGTRFRQAVHHPVRPPRCIGSYAGHPDALRQQLHRLFTGPGGPGLPGPSPKNGRLRAALIPHIDYQRGGVTYAWGFKEVAENTGASLFVIIGTSHYSAHRFTITRKDFQTPLGVLPTDQAYLDSLVGLFGETFFDDELLAHMPEHSIELEVVFLQYLFQARRPIRMVPIVVGSFHDCIYTGETPTRRDDIARLIDALRKIEEAWAEPICYIISGDLAHIGPKFDPSKPPVDEPLLRHSRNQDLAILEQAERADPVGFFRVIAEERDQRNICGLPPTFATLEALRPSHGKVLHYDQYVHPEGFESVSFASVGFYR